MKHLLQTRVFAMLDAWREELDFSDRNAVKKAVAVKSGREAPQLVPLPLQLTNLVTAEGGR